MIITTWLAFVSKEMKFIKVLLYELKAVALVPALWENIK
jgi:hypothetical protein